MKISSLITLASLVLATAEAADPFADIPDKAKEFSCTPAKLFEGDTLVVKMSVPHPHEMSILSPDRKSYVVNFCWPDRPVEECVVRFSRLPVIRFSTVTASAPSTNNLPDMKPERIFQKVGWYRVSLAINLETDNSDDRINRCRVYYAGKRAH